MRITLRPVCEADDPFLFELYTSTRAYEMGLVPWTDAQKLAFLQMQFAAQRSSYASEYPNAKHTVICSDDDPVGRLYLHRGQDTYHILDITLAERQRNKGTGSAVLREILREADEAVKPTIIYVENFNPSMRLFERLGFRVASAKDFQLLLERPPTSLEPE